MDSALYQLLQDYPGVQHEKTDVFRDRVDYSPDAKRRLAAARKAGAEAVRAEQAALGRLNDVEGGVLIDLLLSYRDVQAWDDMIKLADTMPTSLAQTVLVREQRALALNRAGRGEEAEQVLLDLLADRGPSSETCALLGRVYKDRWAVAVKTAQKGAQRAGDAHTAERLLDQAIAAYLQGFEADWRDAFPGINAVTLMSLKQPADPRRLELIPVVRYAVQRRIAEGPPDYWDHATLVELAILEGKEPAARAATAQALGAFRQGWEVESTTRNLRLIREGRARNGESELPWASAIEQDLLRKANPSQQAK